MFTARRDAGSALGPFLKNHAKGIVDCDFTISVTSSMQVLSVFVAREVGSRRIVHSNVTGHLTAEWTLQQFRECLALDHSCKFVLHGRDAILSTNLDSE